VQAADELPGIPEDNMSTQNANESTEPLVGCLGMELTHWCTAKTSRISRYAAKSSCACEWGGWGRLSEDGPGHYNPVRSEDPWGRAEEPLERRCPSALGPSAQDEDFDRQAMGTKDGGKPHDAKTSLLDGKAPFDRPALKP